MTTVGTIAVALRAAWFVAEKAHDRRRRVAPAADRDRSSLNLLKAATLALPVGVAVAFNGVGRVEAGGGLLAACGLALMCAGVFVRWWAIRTLGEFFTRSVKVFDDHRIVRAGLYGHVRHPSYTGTLLGNLGFGLALSNWLSTLVIVVPVAAALAYRMRVEERALLVSFGEEYAEYARRTKRLIPKLF
ncbi:MAG TPA: isoprenylcysteine carboxylmethyltransferase family protein [Pyrinomonadaceae bacterium]|jgi:protein-S-isoprenylcysteine O-methyltransferase Ste14